jgi:hypothetical protein
VIRVIVAILASLVLEDCPESGVEKAKMVISDPMVVVD